MNPEKRELLQAVLDEIKGLRQEVQSLRNPCPYPHHTWTWTQPNLYPYTVTYNSDTNWIT